MFDAPVPVGGMAPRRRNARDRREGTLFIATFFSFFFVAVDRPPTDRTDLCDFSSLLSSFPLLHHRSTRRAIDRRSFASGALQAADHVNDVGRAEGVVHIDDGLHHDGEDETRLRSPHNPFHTQTTGGRTGFPLPPPLTPFGSKSQQTDALADIATKKFGGIDTRHSDFLVS